MAEMDRLGMVVDIFHPSHPAMREVLRISQIPVLAGRTTARELGHRLPGLTDEEIRRIADQGGVIGLHFMIRMLTGRLESLCTVRGCLGPFAVASTSGTCGSGI
jgi:membrane dipeptidase